MPHRDLSGRSIEDVLVAVREVDPGFSLVRKLPGGSWGAWLVRDTSGSPAVLKCLWDSDWRRRLASAEAVVEGLITRGARVPRYRLYGYAPGIGTWHVQNYLSGERVQELTVSLLDDVLAFVELQMGGAEASDALYDHSAKVRRDLAQRVPAWLASAQPHADVGLLREPLADFDAAGERCDFVHGDLLSTQLLTEDGRLAGVLDWDVAGCGDRVQDLALLFYNVFAQADRLGASPNPFIVESLARRGFAVSGPEPFGAYLAYEALRAIAFAIERNAKRIGWRRSLAERSLSAYSAVAARI